MADGWRSSYLARRGLGDDATEDDMEAEFWKLVGPDPPEDDVKVRSFNFFALSRTVVLSSLVFFSLLLS